MTSKKVSSRHDRTDAHVNSQGLWQHAQGFQPDEVPALREGCGQGLPPLTKELSAIDIYLHWKN